ncbi:MAG: hypothetical protein KDD00_12690 [Ignavibacteriae bacterium]|nr:hypothetical protein [Ignavibacteriota bacterium]
MFKNNLTELLKTFSAKELKEFRGFLNSSYFNKRQAVTNLFEIIVKFHPEFDSRFFEKEYIYERLFPGKKYNDSSLRVLTHYLTELTEKFIVIQKLESNETEYSLQLGNALFERNQIKLLEKSITSAFKSLDKSVFDSEDYFYYKFRIQNQMTYFRYASNYAYLDKIILQSDWENVFEDFTNYYLLKSMIMYLNSINLQKLVNKKFRTASFGELINKIKPEDYADIPVIRMYYYLIKMKLDKGHETYYFQLKDLLSSTKKDLNIYDLIGAYVHMEAYCTERITEGIKEFEMERFELYKNELNDKTYLMNDNTMSPLFYRNVVLAGLTLKEFEWTRNFINKYRSGLNKKFRNNYYFYGMAKYEFSVKNFESSLDLISKIKFDEVYMKINTKILYLQLLYELGYEDTLISSLENFRHFLNNNKLIPDERKILYSKFYKFLNKIVAIRDKNKKAESGILKKNISKENFLPNKDWLLEKVKSL